MWRRGQKGNSTACWALTCLITSPTLGLVIRTLLAAALVVNSRVNGFMSILGLCGSFKQSLLRDWKFLPPPQLPLVFTARSYEALFSWLGTLGCRVFPRSRMAHFPGVPPSFYLPHVNVGPPIPPATTVSPLPYHIFSTLALQLYPSDPSGRIFIL